ncbi:hypothetical protein PGQ11_002825 [Apiospora arundinis]|uniref:Uncharacterized protein n=1 Tax=Apiospora arundinis TaxID=335852 RepID=A0ABR2J371_9PEZI
MGVEPGGMTRTLPWRCTSHFVVSAVSKIREWQNLDCCGSHQVPTSRREPRPLSVDDGLVLSTLDSHAAQLLSRSDSPGSRQQVVRGRHHISTVRKKYEGVGGAAGAVVIFITGW